MTSMLSRLTAGLLWALAAGILVVGGTLTLIGVIAGGENSGLFMFLLGLPTAMLTLFLASLALIVSHARDALLTLRWTLLAAAGSFFTPIALLAVLSATGGGALLPGELLSLIVCLILGPGAFYLIWREMFPRTTSRL
jgi:hypothetical protein